MASWPVQDPLVEDVGQDFFPRCGATRYLRVDRFCGPAIIVITTGLRLGQGYRQTAQQPTEGFGSSDQPKTQKGLGLTLRHVALRW